MDDKQHQMTISILFLICGFVVLGYTLKVGYTDTNRDMVMMVVGFIISNITAILNYWIGTSLSSSKKTDLLAEKMEPKP